MKNHRDPKIRKHDRTEQAEAEPLEGTLHGLDLASNNNVTAFWQVLLNSVDMLLHFIRHAAKIAAVHRRVHIDHRLRGVVRNLRGPRSVVRLHEIP